MKAERQQKERTSRVIQPSKEGGGHIVDNRERMTVQGRLIHDIESTFPIQRKLKIKYYAGEITTENALEYANELYKDDPDYLDNNIKVSEIEDILKELASDDIDRELNDFDIKDMVLERHKDDSIPEEDQSSDISPEDSHEIPEVGKMVRAKDSEISDLHLAKQAGLKKWKRFLKTTNPDLYTFDKMNFYVRLDHISDEDAESIFEGNTKAIVKSSDSYYGYVC